jgi:hypothetical protein
MRLNYCRSSAIFIMMEYRKKYSTGRGKIYRKTRIQDGCVRINPACSDSKPQRGVLGTSEMLCHFCLRSLCQDGCVRISPVCSDSNPQRGILVLSDQSRREWPCFNPPARTYVGSRSIEWFGRGTDLDAGCVRDVGVDNMDVQTADYWFRKLLVPHIDACLGMYPDGIFHLRDVDQDCLRMAERFRLAYSENGRRQEALRLMEPVVAAHKRTLGEEHPETLASMHALANCYSEAGRQQEVLRLMETVVAARKRQKKRRGLDRGAS